MVWIRYPKHVWFSMGIKLHAHDKFISLLMGFLVHELLMSLRNNTLLNFMACTYMYTCMHIQTDKFPLEYYMAYTGKTTHHLKKRPNDDSSMPHNS